MSLGSLSMQGHLFQHYLATLHADGVIMLVPAEVLPMERYRELCTTERRAYAEQHRIDDEPPF